MASGVELLLKQLLKATGVSFTPEELTQEFNNIRTLIPKFAGDAKAILENTEVRYSSLKDDQQEMFLKLADVMGTVQALAQFMASYMELQQHILAKLEEIDMKLPGLDNVLPAGQGAATQLTDEQLAQMNLVKEWPANGN